MKYNKVRANFGERSYNFIYGAGALNTLEEQVNILKLGKSIAIVSHPKLKKLFGSQIINALKNSGRKIHWILIAPGETNKTLESVYKLYVEFSKAKIDKSSAVIALGGGMLQDLTCYSAATYLRGVPFIQIPTTLLSQADIGIGGCAIDHPMGKSLVGTFYQPKLAIIDPNFLSTLPKNEIINGISEIINKVVCLGGKDITTLNRDIPKLVSGDKVLMSKYVAKANAVKLSIIENDEIGSKVHRLILDFGHTLTYAIEKATNYTLPHGFALGIGMHAALRLSEQMAGLSKTTSLQILELIKKSGLPTKIPHNLKVKTLLNLMHRDQKAKNGQIRYILLSDAGKSFVSKEIENKVITKLLEQLY